MTRSKFVSVIVVIAALAVIVAQYLHNNRLKREAGHLKASEATVLGTTVSGLVATGEVASSGQASEEVAGSSASPARLGTLKEILAQRDPLKRIRAMLEFVENLPAEQIGMALLELRNASPDWDPEARFLGHMLLTRWGKEDPETAFASIKMAGAKGEAGAIPSILSSLASVDPQRAIDWLNDPENSITERKEMGHVLAGTIAKEWVRQDPEAAMKWAASLPDEQRGGALSGVIENLVRVDPQRAADMVMGLESGDERHDLVGDVATSWGKQNPTDAVEWARAVEEPEVRREAVEEVLDGWAQTAPADAATYLDGLPQDERTEVQISEVAREWARIEPAEAAAWLGTQTEGEGTQRSMGEVMWHWTTRDPEAASTWLAEQPPSDSRDIGAEALAKAAFENDPEGALIWASTISNEERRTNSTGRYLARWNEQDAAAAQAWANQNGVQIPAGGEWSRGKD
ncbi:MAG: hypothetical protein AAF514_05415 [Verrucomicrobiota bacterium]